VIAIMDCCAPPSTPPSRLPRRSAKGIRGQRQADRLVVRGTLNPVKEAPMRFPRRRMLARIVPALLAALVVFHTPNFRLQRIGCADR
jgi:hypothetical protein